MVRIMRKVKKKDNVLKEWVLFLLLIGFLIEDPLSQLIPIIGYYDEVATIIALLWVLKSWAKTDPLSHYYIQKWKFKLYSCILGIFILGILSNLLFGYQSFIYILIDQLAFLKFFGCLLAGMTFDFYSFGKRFAKKVVSILKILTVLQFVLILHESFFSPWFPYLRDFPPFRSMQLFYSNQTYLVAYSVFAIALLILFNGNVSSNKWYVALLSLAIISTMRSKGWGFLLIAFLIALGTKAFRIKHPYLFAGMCLPAVLFIAWEKIELYFFAAGRYSPRKIILLDSLRLANQHFPLGTGFATFCSPGAALGGSPIYENLGSNYTSGMIGSAINDMYIGYLIGQFGYIGFLFMLFIIGLLFSQIWKLQKIDRNMFLGGTFLILYLVIATLGESPFFAPYTIGFAFVIGILLGTRREKINDEKDFVD